MADILDTRIAPKLDRKTHQPIRTSNGWEYWFIRDYPAHSIHNKDGLSWHQDDWDTAVNIFEDRIYGRFLNVIGTIEKKLFSGFVVMALDCLLCETLEQFYEGIDESPRSGGTFRRFLTTTSFKQHFGTDDSPKTSMAAIFYDQIRSGILHMAEVKKSSLIVVEESEPLVRWSDDHVGLVVNRKKFHQQVIHEFTDFLTSLRHTPVNPLAQPWGNFKIKMDFICRA